MAYNMMPYVIMASTMVIPGVVILVIVRWWSRRRMRVRRRYR